MYHINKLLFIGIYFLLLISTFADAENLNIITKAEWNGIEPKAELTKLSAPVERVIIAHTAGTECNDVKTCSQQALNLQDFHMKSLQFDDVAYNFMIGNDGNVYEGRGWDMQGAFARGFNAGSLGIAFFGTFQRNLPSDKALNAAKDLIETGVGLGKIKSDYELLGSRQVSATESPGSALYDVIKQWPHWSQQAA